MFGILIGDWLQISFPAGVYLLKLVLKFPLEVLMRITSFYVNFIFFVNTTNLGVDFFNFSQILILIYWS